MIGLDEALGTRFGVRLLSVTDVVIGLKPSTSVEMGKDGHAVDAQFISASNCAYPPFPISLPNCPFGRPARHSANTQLPVPVFRT